jgi:hypothetical protein
MSSSPDLPRPAGAVPAARPELQAHGRRSLLQALALTPLAWSASAAGEETLASPAGPVVLSVAGQVQRTNAPGRADFDMAMLAAMPQRSFRTQTPWYAQPRRFTGPLLRDVLQAARAQGQTLRLTALNDYRVDMPLEDARRFDVIVARLLDDQPMPVREKGPLFVIYPFDDVPALRTATHYGRSAWQLRTITVI